MSQYLLTGDDDDGGVVGLSWSHRQTVVLLAVKSSEARKNAASTGVSS